MKIKEQHCLLKGYRREPRAAWLNIQLISTTINLLTLVTDNMIYMYSKWQIDKHFNLSSYPDRSTSYEKLRLANTTLNCCISLIRLCCNLVTATVPNINKKIIRNWTNWSSSFKLTTIAFLFLHPIWPILVDLKNEFDRRGVHLFVQPWFDLMNIKPCSHFFNVWFYFSPITHSLEGYFLFVRF